MNTQDSTIVKSGTCFVVLSAYSQCVGCYVRYIRETSKLIRKYRIELKKNEKFPRRSACEIVTEMYFGDFSPFPSIFDRKIQCRIAGRSCGPDDSPQMRLPGRRKLLELFPGRHYTCTHGTVIRSPRPNPLFLPITIFPFRIFSLVVPKFPKKSIPLNNQTRRSGYVSFYSYHHLYAFLRPYL